MSAANSEGYERRAAKGEIRFDAETRRIRGYAIVFDSPSEDLGGFRERIMPDAVNRTLSEALDVRALVDHDSARIIGRTRAGTLSLRKDNKGLRIEIDPPNTTNARDILESIQRGDVTGMSFGFRALEDDWHMEDGFPVREVLDMRVREVSVVSFPAYPATDVAVAQRSLGAFQQANRGKSLDWWRKWHQTRMAR